MLLTSAATNFESDSIHVQMQLCHLTLSSSNDGVDWMEACKDRMTDVLYAKVTNRYSRRAGRARFD